MPPGTVLVVGAGLAGSRAAETLRADGFNGRIVLAGDEPTAPYERPALSKAYLAGAKEEHELLLRPAGSGGTPRSSSGSDSASTTSTRLAGRLLCPRERSWHGTRW
jgi:hypothetical protein